MARYIKAEDTSEFKWHQCNAPVMWQSPQQCDQYINVKKMDVKRFIAFSMQKLGYGREKKDQQEAINFKTLFKFLGIAGIKLQQLHNNCFCI